MQAWLSTNPFGTVSSLKRKLRFWLFIRYIRISVSTHRETTVLLGIVSAYALTMYLLTTARMQTLRSSAWDLGNYNQALFTFTHDRMLFYWTSDLPQNPGGSLFGGHFSPILALIAPIYYIFSRPETLLAIQSLVIGLGAVPVWLIAKNVVKIDSRSLRLVLVSVYLLQPALLGLNWFDFHPEAFIPLLYLLSAYFLMKRDFLPGAACSILLLSTIEYAPLMLLMLALTLAAGDVLRFARQREGLPLGRRLVPWFTLVAISIAWLFLSITVIRFFNPHDPTTSGSTANWTVLGADNLLQVPLRAILNPGGAITALLNDGTAKLSFLVILGLPFALLPLFSPKFWFMSAPWLLPSLLSNSPGYYNIGLQYPSFILPPLVLVFLGQTSNLLNSDQGLIRNRLGRVRTFLGTLRGLTPKVNLKALIVISTMVALTLSNPIVSLLVATSPFSNYGFPYPSSKSTTVGQFLNYIPQSASVLTDYYIFPLVSSRPNAFTWPYVIDYPTIPFVQYMRSLTVNTDFILLDLDTFGPYNALILSFAQKNFGVLGYSDGLLLLEKGYLGNPAVFTPYQHSFAFQDLNLVEGRLADDLQSSYGKVLSTVGNSTVPSFWTGPNVILPPGEYSIEFRLKLSSEYSGHIIGLRTLAHNISVRFQLVQMGRAVFQIFEESPPSLTSQALSQTDVNSSSLPPGVYQTVVQNVKLDTFSTFEFAGENVSSVVLSLDKIEVFETKPLASVSNLNVEYPNGTSMSLSSLPTISKIVQGHASQITNQGEDLARFILTVESQVNEWACPSLDRRGFP